MFENKLRDCYRVLTYEYLGSKNITFNSTSVTFFIAPPIGPEIK